MTLKRIINLGQQLGLGTIREHVYSHALCISQACFYNPSGIESRLEFAFRAQANCQSNIGTSHLNILNLRRKNNLSFVHKRPTF